MVTGDKAANLDLCIYTTHGLAVKVLFRTTFTVTRDLGLYGFIGRIDTHIPQWDSNQGRKAHQIFAPPPL
jgi:hypothetical protein